MSEAPTAPRADLHVHSEWSWDAAHGDMLGTCRRALEAGLSEVAFTEHADFRELAEHPRAVVDMPGYLDAVEDCRRKVPGLTIRTGVELGQPHMHPEETAALLHEAGGGLDRVLASMHLAKLDHGFVDLGSASSRVEPARWPALVRSSLMLTLDLVASAAPFEVLAHLEYAKRYWPHDALPYRDEDYEEEYRAVLASAARRRCVLEINTTRGGPRQRALGPGVRVLRWWREAGGMEVCFGSDAHDPSSVGRGLADAAMLAATAGFHPRDDGGFWSRRTR